MSADNPMEHEWIKEHLPVHIVDGLDAAERTRMESHLADCADCCKQHEELKRLDGEMLRLFAPARAGADLEERVIRSVRQGRPSLLRLPGGRIPHSIAAVFLLGLVGFFFQGGELPSLWAVSRMQTPQLDAGMGDMGSSSAMPRDISGDQDLQDDLQAGSGYMSQAMSKAMAGEQSHLADKLASSLKEEEGRARVGGVPQPLPGPPGPAAPGCYNFTNNGPSSILGDPDVEVKDPYFRQEQLLDQVPRVPAGRTLADSKKEIIEREGKRGPGGQGFSGGKVKVREADGETPGKKGDGGGGSGERQAQTQQTALQESGRKVIRSGTMEFEVESFDSTVGRIHQIVIEEGGFVATVNSSKLPNGKVEGTVTIRVGPDHLDTLILKLRALGELKTQNIGSQDVTKMYTDLESRLRAARAMEERLLEIIKKGKGEIKDLLAAERELGEWRTKIEAMEGEIRYYNNLVSLSTLTVQLYEKEIRSPWSVTETEKVQAGIEAEDVETAHKNLLAAVQEAKGRVTKSEFKQHAAGQFSAVVHCEIPPDNSGAFRDRLKQIGHVARFDLDKVQQTEGGSGKPGEVKLKKNDAQFFLLVYNLANIQPRETTHLNLACMDAEEVYKQVLARVEKAGGRVVSSSLNRQKSDQTTGNIAFEVKSGETYETVLADVRILGEVMRLTVQENPDSANTTRSKRGFNLRIAALGTVAPRETAQIHLAASGVPAAYQAIRKAVQDAGGRILAANLNEQNRQNITAYLDFDLRRENESAVEAAMRAAGMVYSRVSERQPDSENVVDSKTRLQVTLFNLENVPARESFNLEIETGEVSRAEAALKGLVTDRKGRVVSSSVSKNRSGQDVARLTVDVPLAAATGVSQEVQKMGIVRGIQASRNPQVPDSELAIARLEVAFSNVGSVTGGESFSDQIRKGLATSLKAIFWSLRFVVVGLCVVLPFALFAWVCIRLSRRLRGTPTT